MERAAEQHGFLGVDDARELGIDPGYLRKMAAVGKLEHRWRGVYRLRAIPVTARDEFHEAVFWAGHGAVIAGEAALALWDLADVNPRQIEVAAGDGRPARRAQDNPRVRVLKFRVGRDEIDEVDNIPVVTARTAIAQTIRGGTDPGLIHQAIAAARGRQLIGETSAARLLVALDDRERTGKTGKVA